jgi:predicted nucleic acid-binding protein
MARRVVLDTNVVVAALRSRQGASAAVLLGAGTGQFEFCISIALFFEYESALKRPESGLVLSMAAIDDIRRCAPFLGQR